LKTSTDPFIAKIGDDNAVMKTNISEMRIDSNEKRDVINMPSMQSVTNKIDKKMVTNTDSVEYEKKKVKGITQMKWIKQWTTYQKNKIW